MKTLVLSAVAVLALSGCANLEGVKEKLDEIRDRNAQRHALIDAKLDELYNKQMKSKEYIKMLIEMHGEKG